MKVNISEKQVDKQTFAKSSDSPSDQASYNIPPGTSSTSTPDDIDTQAQFEKFRAMREMIWDSKKENQ